MGKSKISKAAAELGRKGGKVRSAAKTAAVRANAKLGGRPVKLHKVGGLDVHIDAVVSEWSGDARRSGTPVFRAKTAAAARWLERHGFERVEPGARPVLWIMRKEGRS